MTEPDLTLVIGGHSGQELRTMLAAHGVALNAYAQELLEHPGVDGQAPQTVVLTRRSVAELGLPRGGTLPQILTACEEAGLLPCPVATGPALRLALRDQEQAPDSVLSAGRVPTGALHVLSRPLSADHEVPKGFYLRVVDGTTWLRGYRCDDEYVLPPQSMLVLRRPTTGGAVSGRLEALAVRAVVLDLDGTLFDHRESARRGLFRLVRELGADPVPQTAISWERTAERLMGRRRTGEIDRIDYRRLRIRRLLTELGRYDEARDLDGSHCDRLYERFLEVYEEEWVSFADAVPTLRALHELRLPTAILTNGPEERQQRKVRALGVDPWVMGVWTSESLQAKKPEAGTYLTVCEALGVEPPAVLHVGDDEEHDLHGALAAGLQALHLDRQRRRPVAAERITGLREMLERL